MSREVFRTKNDNLVSAKIEGGGGQPFKLAKTDLIAELKLSHNVGGVSKLKNEQVKFQEEQERAEYKKFLAKFTMENFLEKVSGEHIFGT